MSILGNISEMSHKNVGIYRNHLKKTKKNSKNLGESWRILDLPKMSPLIDIFSMTLENSNFELRPSVTGDRSLMQLRFSFAIFWYFDPYRRKWGWGKGREGRGGGAKPEGGEIPPAHFEFAAIQCSGSIHQLRSPCLRFPKGKSAGRMKRRNRKFIIWNIMTPTNRIRP